MPWIAHAGVELINYTYRNTLNTWITAKKEEGIEYRWKIDKGSKLHVVAGPFSDPNIALNTAKQIYVKLFYECMEKGIVISNAGTSIYTSFNHLEDRPKIDGYYGNEAFFFWTKKYFGGLIWPGVFEVSSSLDEFDELKFLTGSVRVVRITTIELENLEECLFLYNEEVERLFNTLLVAERMREYGMKITVYCTLLEHLTESCNKSDEAIKLIENFKKLVTNSNLQKVEKDSLLGYLDSGKKISAKNRIKAIVKKYAKETYGNYSTEDIISKVYEIRNSFAHGEKNIDYHIEETQYIKYVVLDVIKGYMKEKELKENI